jgi:hypothetical protein
MKPATTLPLEELTERLMLVHGCRTVPSSGKVYERCGGRTVKKSVILILRKNRPVQHTFEI